MPENHKRTYGTEIGVSLVGLLPILYLASFGFAVRYFDSPSRPVEDFLITFYSPIIWLHENTPLEQPIEGYLEIWEK